MNHQKTLWTVIPNGLISNGGTTYLRLTVAINPRLYQLSSPPVNPVISDWNYVPNWPASIPSQFQFQFTGGTTVTLTGMPDPTANWPTPDSTVWKNVFPGTTPVTPYAFQDWSQRFIQTDPASYIYSSVKAEYQALIGKYSTVQPTLSMWEETTSRKFAQIPSLSQYGSYVKSARKPHSTFPKPASFTEALEQQAIFFHRGLGFPDGTEKSGDGWKYSKSWPTQGQQLDFHQQVGQMTKYWELQRKLGLAIDFVVPFSGVPSGDGMVQLIAPTTLPLSDHITPQTMYTHTASTIALKSSTGSLHSGWVDLSASQFTLAQIDVDGAGIKFTGFARQLNSAQAANDQAQDQGKAPTVALPSLRSGGLVLFEAGRAASLATFLPQAVSNNTTAESTSGTSLKFYAEDLLQGYRVDIFDDFTNKWHSLHLRAPAFDPDNSPMPWQGSYEYLNPSGSPWWTPTFPDEGLVSMGMTQDPNASMTGGSGPDVYLHEQVWRWMGWSLAAQRPNKYQGIDSDQDAYQYDPEAAGEGSDANVRTHFGPLAGSVPKLRFGRGYRVRARTVDITAASNAYDTTDTTYETYEVPAKSDKPFVYRRFEPVPPPAVILYDQLAQADTGGIGSPGESTHRLVIRSNFNKSADAELDFLRNTLNYKSLPTETTRWIVPPQMSQLLAEHHGMFDDTAANGGWRSDAYDLMTQYDGVFGTDNDGDVAYGGSGQPAIPSQLPYLPDVLSFGAAFEFLPGAPAIYGYGKTVWSGTWPNFKPFRLTVSGILKGTKKAPQWNATNRILTVFVPQADMLQDPNYKTWGFPETNLSSYMGETLSIGPYGADGPYNPTNTAELMGIIGWLDEYQSAGHITAAELNNIKLAAEAGLVWSITPSTQLTFIHATQQPLVLANWDKVQSLRPGLGATYSELTSAPLQVHGPSTTKVDITAAWIDPIDDLSLYPCPQLDEVLPLGHTTVTIPGLPKEIPHQAHVVEIPVTPDISEVDFKTSNKYLHQFGDTKHHIVDYTATLTSRYTEYFPNDTQVPTTRETVAKKVNVLSSARPQSPRVLYAVPAFGWKSAVSGNKKITLSERKGGWLRVYLDRPFYSSGVGELLGVVCIHDKAQIDVERESRIKRALKAQGVVKTKGDSGVVTTLQKYVTQWGMDPIWSSATITTPPNVTDFPKAKTMGPLYLEELGGKAGGIPVDVAGYQVEYDDTRCMYFCDIPMVWGDSYYPFVRLALASFQPDSLSAPDTVHLSRVILADFMQLAPDRLAQVSTHTKPHDLKWVEVFVYGVTPGNSRKPGTYMEVTLEQQAPQIGSSSGELAWVPVPNIDLVMAPGPLPNEPNFVMWKLGFDLPHAVGSVPFRLVIREYELLPEGWGNYDPNSGIPKARHADTQAQPTGKRLVYAATIQI